MRSQARPTRTLLSSSGIRILTDAEGLTAFLSFTPIEARPVLDEAPLRDALREAGVVYGIDEEAIGRCAGATTELEAVVVAQGHEPVEGAPPTLKYRFSVDPYAIVGARSDSERIDYRERGQLPYVKAGDAVATLIKGADPEPGRTVTGEEIKASFEMASGLEPGRNVEVQDDRYIAKIDGGPKLDDHGRIEIEGTWKLDRDIDIHTGNIRYPGPISIMGVVHGGFEVRAKSIKIQGVENNAVLNAEQDIEISGGILGGTVKAGGSVSTRFINNATLTCSGDVSVKLSVVNSEVSSSGYVRAQTIIGGTIASLKGLECVTLSSEANRSTVIFGIDPIKQQRVSELVKKKVEIEGQIHQKREEMAPLLESREALEQNEATVARLLSERSAMEQRIASPSDEDLMMLEALYKQFEELKQQITLEEKNKWEIERKISSLKPQFSAQERDIVTLTKELDVLEAEHQKISQTIEEQKVQPKVIVKGTIFAGSRLSGPRARLVTRKDMRRRIFREIKRTDVDKAEKDSGKARPRYLIKSDRM